MQTLLLVGSLRAASFSGKLADAIQEIAGDAFSFTRTTGGDLPLYNQDLDGEEKPAAVASFLREVDAAQGLVVVTPEFNYGIPGPLKNAIDWASRPAFRSPLKGKPTLIVSVSLAPVGGARAHAQLQQVLAGTLTPVYTAPTFAVGGIHEKFDPSGALTDEVIRAGLERQLTGYLAWARSVLA